jgi:hypothetical protein
MPLSAGLSRMRLSRAKRCIDSLLRISEAGSCSASNCR